MTSTHRPTPYTDTIRQLLATLGYIGTDPRHVEAYIRIEHPTLDGLAAWQFKNEVNIAVACIREGGLAAAESCAKSYGL